MPLGGDLLVVGMGSFGGGELGYASDADVMFVHRAHEAGDDSADDPGLQARATLVVQELKKLLSRSGASSRRSRRRGPAPGGQNGPLVRSLDAYRTYYDRWALTWEFQAAARRRWPGRTTSPATSSS